MLNLGICGICHTGVNVSELRLLGDSDECCSRCYWEALYSSGDAEYVDDAMTAITGSKWQVLATGGGCHVLECVLPFTYKNGVDRIWVSGDDTLDSYAGVSSFGSRVWVGLMAYGLEAEDKDNYCIAECTRETGAVWNDDGEIENVTVEDICELIMECIHELRVEFVED